MNSVLKAGLSSDLRNNSRLARLQHCANHAFAASIPLDRKRLIARTTGCFDDQLGAIRRNQHDGGSRHTEPLLEFLKHLRQHASLPSLIGHQYTDRRQHIELQFMAIEMIGSMIGGHRLRSRHVPASQIKSVACSHALFPHHELRPARYRANWQLACKSRAATQDQSPRPP